MKPKFSASALKAMALEGRLSACEMRASAARHAATLDADNHAAFVEAFLVQLGAPEQHARIRRAAGDLRLGLASPPQPNPTQSPTTREGQ